MSEHTPGPWVTAKGPIKGKATWSVSAKSPRAGHWRVYNIATIDRNPESEANAHLIAKAWTIPQLRDHLRQALRQWSMYAEFEEIDLTDEKSPEAEMYRAAKAALKLGEEG